VFIRECRTNRNGDSNRLMTGKGFLRGDYAVETDEIHLSQMRKGKVFSIVMTVPLKKINESVQRGEKVSFFRRLV